MRKLALVVIVAVLTIAAAPQKKPPAPAAPPEVPHAFALYLGNLSNDGAHTVTFRARAHGTRFYFEEPSGVTVYGFVKGKYVRERFVAGATLERVAGR